MANTAMAYIVMALYSYGPPRKPCFPYSGGLYKLWPYIVMALYSYGLYSYGLYSYGLYSYDLCSYGLYSLYSHGPLLPI